MLTYSQNKRTVLEVKAFHTIRHRVTVTSQIFHRNNFTGFITSGVQAVWIRQIVIGELLKYRNQVTIGSDFILKSVIASKQLTPCLVYDVSLDDETVRVFCYSN